MLTIDGCRRRLERLGSLMADRQIDLALITNPQHVYYFSGFLPNWTARAALAVRGQDAILVCGAEPEKTAATEVRTYPANAIGTIRLDQASSVAE
jgi:Xaa-Pro aminopeptidase